MRVLLAVHHFPPRYSAGAELYTYRLARWLIRHGHEAEVVCVERIDARGAGPLRAHADTYEGVPVWRLDLDLRKAPAEWVFRNEAVMAWAAEHLATYRPDLVHLQSGYLITPSVLEAAIGRGIATAVTLHDYWFLCPRITLLRGDGSLCAGPPDDPAACVWCERLASRRYRLADQATSGQFGRLAQQLGLGAGGRLIGGRRAYLRQILSQVDLAIAPSPFVAEQFRGTVAPERLHSLTYGIDPAPTAAGGAPRDGGALRLGYLGQVVPHKGIHTILAALRRLPPEGRPVELHVFGDADAQESYGRLLRREANASVFFHGKLENTQIGPALQSLDALVVSSVWYEVGPMTVMEAHAVGTPVLASAIGNIPFIVRDEVDGLHFQPGDADDLARQIARLRGDPELLARLRAGTRLPKPVDTELSELFQLYTQAVQAAPVVPSAGP